MQFPRLRPSIFGGFLTFDEAPGEAKSGNLVWVPESLSRNERVRCWAPRRAEFVMNDMQKIDIGLGDTVVASKVVVDDSEEGTLRPRAAAE